MKNSFAPHIIPHPFGRRTASQSPETDVVSRSLDRVPIVQHIARAQAVESGEAARQMPSREERAKMRRRRLDGQTSARADHARVFAAAGALQTRIIDKLDAEVASTLPRHELAVQLAAIIDEVLAGHELNMNQVEQRDLVTMMLNEMIGLGPLESLLTDDSVTDILVNNADNVYVERAGKLELTNIKFRDNSHVMATAMRIANRVGRRVDEAQPYVDARLADGSRVNIIAPPLALKGPTISIRKFTRQPMSLDRMVEQGNLTPAMATVLSVAAHSRLNIIVSGGTGAGKTTLLNAL
jgi:pilus assembly protein CpaF